MADEADYAAEREELVRSKALENHKSLIQIEREHLSKLEEKGLVLHCRYCEEPLPDYTSRYCDSECRQLDEELRAAERRKNG